MATPKSKSSSGRRGLLAGGNWIIDQVKLIDVYPQREQLANILSQSQGTGGAPYNVLINLAKLGADFPLSGAGLVGKDGLGQFILDDCKKHKIDTRHLRSTAEAQTSFTDVMTEQSIWISRKSRRRFSTSVTCSCSMNSTNRTPSSAPRPRACWPPPRKPG
jgi:sugar/nucleoside kinase (ribokinase family)